MVPDDFQLPISVVATLSLTSSNANASCLNDRVSNYRRLESSNYLKLEMEIEHRASTAMPAKENKLGNYFRGFWNSVILNRLCSFLQNTRLLPKVHRETKNWDLLLRLRTPANRTMLIKSICSAL
jgi:hypothetical protein